VRKQIGMLPPGVGVLAYGWIVDDCIGVEVEG